jgi:carboxyl-terminal processing protease
MTIRFPTPRFVALGTLGLTLVCAAAFGRSDRKFSTAPTLATESRFLIQLLEQAHYNRDAISSSDYVQIIPSFMSDLDGQRLFFLASDKTTFTDQYAKNIYWNVSTLGNIDAAYEIFGIYENRVVGRVNWIFDELKKDFDLTTNDTYRADRTKSEWPATSSSADVLWRQRLKFELIGELMNKKTIDQAKETVRKRYERMLKNMEEIDESDLAELYLANIARLYDPHSTYFSAATFEDFGIQMKLQLVGIGALLGRLHSEGNRARWPRRSRQANPAKRQDHRGCAGKCRTCRGNRHETSKSGRNDPRSQRLASQAHSAAGRRHRSVRPQGDRHHPGRSEA